jgi:GDP-4-dehydro-6-deoxy-D-mannose reductase
VRKLLVTGHTGFVGRTLFQSTIEPAASHAWHLNALPDALDIRDPALVEHLQRDMPDAVLHLAARTNVEEAFRNPDDCFDVNFNGTRNLLRALRKVDFAGRLLYVSSGDCYGALPESALPVNEERPLRPRNPYAVSKTAAEALCYQWSQTEDLNVVIVRPFNHIGPGQDTRFAIASFAEQIARIARGLIPPIIRTGNLDVTRDFTDVRDVLRAYFSLLEQGRSGEAYNVASGQETRLRDVLDWLLAMAGVTASIEIDSGRRRAAEQRRVVADVSKIKRDANWAAQIPLRDALRVTLNYWEKRVADE